MCGNLTKRLPLYPVGLPVIFLYVLYASNKGRRFPDIFFSSDLEKLVTMRPEQGFMHTEVLTLIFLTHSRSFAEHRDSFNNKYVDFNFVNLSYAMQPPLKV